MKTYRALCVLMTMFLLSFANHAYAASAREDLVHAYVLLKMANNNYGGHRATALHHIEEAAHDIGLDLKGGGTERERQWKSDAQVAEAGRILKDVRYRLDRRDRDRAVAHLDRAIREVDDALGVK